MSDTAREEAVRRVAVQGEETQSEPDLLGAAEELLEVADMRGDSTLPAPWDDLTNYTARMQTAWDEFRAAVVQVKKGEAGVTDPG